MLMQAAMSLDTQRSCTVYLHTDGKQQKSVQTVSESLQRSSISNEIVHVSLMMAVRTFS